jgi:20S proteasome alpha/beta subunit
MIEVWLRSRRQCAIRVYSPDTRLSIREQRDQPEQAFAAQELGGTTIVTTQMRVDFGA